MNFDFLKLYSTKMTEKLSVVVEISMSRIVSCCVGMSSDRQKCLKEILVICADDRFVSGYIRYFAILKDFIVKTKHFSIDG